MSGGNGDLERTSGIIIAVILLVFATGVGFWFYNRGDIAVDPGVRSNAENPVVAYADPPPETSAPLSPDKNRTTLMPVSEIAHSLNSADTTVADDLSTLESILGEYRRQYSANPVGDNSEITAALQGQNDRQLAFIPMLPGSQINGRGELVDRWGTPYFFHAESGTEMEIRSAGPDREFYTEDDFCSSD